MDNFIEIIIENKKKILIIIAVILIIIFIKNTFYKNKGVTDNTVVPKSKRQGWSAEVDNSFDDPNADRYRVEDDLLDRETVLEEN